MVVSKKSSPVPAAPGGGGFLTTKFKTDSLLKWMRAAGFLAFNGVECKLASPPKTPLLLHFHKNQGKTPNIISHGIEAVDERLLISHGIKPVEDKASLSLGLIITFHTFCGSG